MSAPRAVDIQSPLDEPSIGRTPRAPVLSLDLPRYVRFHVACIATLVVLCLVGQYFALVMHHDHLFGFVRDFDLDEEANVPTWFQSATLLLAAILLDGVARARRSLRDGGWTRWRLLAFGVLLLSMDEAASLHEKLLLPIQALRSIPKYRAFSWVVPGVLIVAAVFAFFLPWLRTLPARTRNRLLLAGAVYLGGAVGMEAIGGIEAITIGLGNWAYVVTYTIEETLEMIGTLLLIVAALEHLKSLHPEPVLHIASAPPATLVENEAGRSIV